MRTAHRSVRADGLRSWVLALPADGLLLTAAALPFIVSGVALVVGVGSSYVPVSDHAMSEMLVRDVGRHPVLFGLYSRDDWSHPGPLLYYLLAPFYWVTGGSSIGLSLGTLAINGGSVVGMGLIARRRAGTAAMAATFLGTALLMRTLGAEFLGDFWNCFVTVMPFGLLAFLAWSMLAGDRWALPVAVFVATFLAQTHVGFVVLALPLLALGGIGLVLSVRRHDASDGLRSLLRPGLVSGALGLLLWLPPLIDLVTGDPANLVNLVNWFRTTEGAPHSVLDGLWVISGPFGIWPEWATTKVAPYYLDGQSPYLADPIIPWTLLVVVAAAAVLWRRGGTGRHLVVMAAATAGVGVIAVARTVGPAFQYRLLWTFIPALVAFVVVALAAWGLVSSRWPAAQRGVAAVTAAVLLLLTGVNVVTAATAGVPNPAETAAMASLSSQVLEHVGDTEGTVLVSDPYSGAAWYARGIVLQLEKEGIDSAVPPERTWEAAEHRVHRQGPVAVRLVVVLDEAVTAFLDRPDLALVAEWSAVSDERITAFEDDRTARRADVEAGRMTELDYVLRDLKRTAQIRGVGGAITYRVAVFEETLPGD